MRHKMVGHLALLPGSDRDAPPFGAIAIGRWLDTDHEAMGLGRWIRGMVPGRYPEWYRERRSWELGEDARSTVRKLRALVSERKRAVQATGRPDGHTILGAADEELDCAENILTFDEHRRAPFGSHVTAAQVHLNTARLLWLKSFLSSPDEVAPYLPGLLAVVREHLTRDDPRRVATEIVMEKYARRRLIDERELVAVLEAVDVAHSVALREKLRAASFVRIVCGVAAFLFVLAAAVAVLTAFFPDAVPLCFNPSRQSAEPATHSKVPYVIVCPAGSQDSLNSTELDQNFAAVTTWGDYLVVETVGLVAAGVAAASALRKIRGTSTSYPVPVALAALKLPAGALTAVLGLLLMRGGFVPGLTALDSSAQIIAWAVIFGYSQELFTKWVDRQGQRVLESVRGPLDPPGPAGHTTVLPAAGPAPRAGSASARSADEDAEG
ncbi:hypothetical protein ACFV19_31915 [Streptomyces griseoluteus]|uniref:hypothetical protein n=1 Tax=Streptomyces griseoluteus TaxID=29306 RepID=UPI003675DE8E